MATSKSQGLIALSPFFTSTNLGAFKSDDRKRRRLLNIFSLKGGAYIFKAGR